VAPLIPEAASPVDGANHLKQGFKSFKEDKKAKKASEAQKRGELLTKSAFCQKWRILKVAKAGCDDVFENDAREAKCQKRLHHRCP
jgi:hypothetical protein